LAVVMAAGAGGGGWGSFRGVVVGVELW
jgi:hypothetical protein